jgi:hypothetical protein
MKFNLAVYLAFPGTKSKQKEHPGTFCDAKLRNERMFFFALSCSIKVPQSSSFQA